jgi:predicted MFS family arabinose efflux permease
MATDLIPFNLRATGIGIYSTVIGLTSLVASIVGGQLWDKINPQATFIYGAVAALIGVIALLGLTKNNTNKN